jgi:hypothetical protein
VSDAPGGEGDGGDNPLTGVDKNPLTGVDNYIKINAYNIQNKWPVKLPRVSSRKASGKKVLSPLVPRLLMP